MLAFRDGRYSLEAFRFLFDSLPRAVQLAGKEAAVGTKKHITGQELLAGMSDCAQQLFGPLAAEVWRSWGVHEALDWGRIVFLLVDNGLLSRQESDTLEDFDCKMDFDETFVRHYRVLLPPPSVGPQGG